MTPSKTSSRNSEIGIVWEIQEFQGWDIIISVARILLNILTLKILDCVWIVLGFGVFSFTLLVPINLKNKNSVFYHLYSRKIDHVY